MTDSITDTEEAKVLATNPTGPRVTPDKVDAEIMKTEYTLYPSSCLTICVLTLRNGFTVTGESACASPENFNKELGEEFALRNAKGKVWPFLGFRLCDKLAAPEPVPVVTSWQPMGTAPKDREILATDEFYVSVMEYSELSGEWVCFADGRAAYDAVGKPVVREPLHWMECPKIAGFHI